MRTATPTGPAVFVGRRLIIAALALLHMAAVAHAAGRVEFELRPRQRITFDGQVTDKDQSTTAGVDFGVIPTSPIRLKPYYNVFTGMTENRPVPGNPHPIPVLRAAKVRVFGEKPDVSKLAIDQVNAYENEAQFDDSHQYAVASDGQGNVRLISITHSALPQDKYDQWVLRGAVQPLSLVEHIDDPVADRGRAVPAKSPLPVRGTLVFGRRQNNYGPGAFWKMTLPDGRPEKVTDFVEGRMALNGSIVDRVDMRTLEIKNPAGQLIGKINLDPIEAAEFAISPDGRKVAVSMERFVEVPNELPQREISTAVYSFKGKLMGRVVGYDDPAFMPDGRLLLTGRGADNGLFIGDYTTGKVTPIEIKDGPAADAPGLQWPRWPAVSPDGKWVAYVSQRGVYVVGTDGRGWTPVWVAGGDQSPQTVPVFSPDSSLIAVNIIPLNVMTGPGTVSVFDLKQHVRQELPTSQGADSDVPLVWQP